MVPIDPKGYDTVMNNPPMCICWCGGQEGVVESLVGYIEKNP